MLSRAARGKTSLIRSDWAKKVLTCDEVCVVAAELVLLLEVDLAEGDEGEDGDVVADADEADQPEGGRKHEDIAEVDLRVATLAFIWVMLVWSN